MTAMMVVPDVGSFRNGLHSRPESDSSRNLLEKRHPGLHRVESLIARKRQRQTQCPPACACKSRAPSENGVLHAADNHPAGNDWDRKARQNSAGSSQPSGVAFSWISFRNSARLQLGSAEGSREGPLPTSAPRPKARSASRFEKAAATELVGIKPIFHIAERA